MNVSRKIYYFLLIAFVLGVAVRFAFLAFTGLDNNIHDSMSDQSIYLDLSHDLVNGKGFVVSVDIWVANAGVPTSIMPPLYPLFLAGIFFLFGTNLIVVRILQILLSSLIVIFVYLITRHAFDEKSAILASVITIFYPPLVMYVRPIMSEGLFYFQIVLLVWATYKLTREGPSSTRYFVLWGVIAGLTILTRTESAILITMFFAFIVFQQLKQTRKIYIGKIASLILTTLVILTPYALYNHAAHGNFSPLPNARWKFWDHTWWAEMKSHPEWIGVTLPERKVVPDWKNLTELERDQYLWKMAIQFVRNNPRIFIIQRLKNLVWAYPLIPRELFIKGGQPDGYAFGPTSLDDVVKYVTPAEIIRVWSFRIVFVLALGGIFIILRHRYWRANILLIGLIWNVAHEMLFVGSERLRLQIDPLLIVLAAFFIIFVTSRGVGTVSTSNGAAL